MAPHDNAYKLIFSHADMVRDLLQGFVPEDWVKRLNFNTLEKVDGQYVSEDLLTRSNDVVWRLRLNDGEWIYLYVLLEFQSRNDHWMALRLMTYIGLLYQNLIAHQQLDPGNRLPSIFPIVIYNGERRWTAPLDLSQLITPPSGSLSTYSPQLRYFLLDEKRVAKQPLPPDNNLVTTLVRLENSQHPKDVQRSVDQLLHHLQSPAHDSLRRAFTIWIRRIIINRISSTNDVIPETVTLEEINTMLEERMGQWANDWKQQGLQQGRLEGLQEGRQEGQIKLLTHLLEQRFGALLPAHTQRLETASQAQLDAWGKAVLTAQSLEEFFSIH